MLIISDLETVGIWYSTQYNVTLTLSFMYFANIPLYNLR